MPLTNLLPLLILTCILHACSPTHATPLTPNSSTHTPKPKTLSFPLHTHSTLTHRHLQETNSTIPLPTPLYQGYGTHYIDLYIGTPPQRQTLIVDTGSALTAFPCEKCQSPCGENHHLDPVYESSLSLTFHQGNCEECKSGTCKDGECHWKVSYTEGSHWTAIQAWDTVSLTNATQAPTFPLTFGCQTSISGLFITQLADGIMGCSIHSTSFPHQLYTSQLIDSPSFSLCFTSHQDYHDSDTAGVMTFGGTLENTHTTPMVYGKAEITNGKHGIFLRKMYLTNRVNTTVAIEVSTSTLQGHSVIVDSGTTDTFMTSSISRQFHTAWKEVFDIPYTNKGMALEKEDVLKLPTIIFQLVGNGNTFDPTHPDDSPGLAGNLDLEYPNDIVLFVPPTHYFLYDSDKQVYMPLLFFTEYQQSTIGANVMNGHEILFETEGKNRIGVAVSECEYDGVSDGTQSLVPSIVPIDSSEDVDSMDSNVVEPVEVPSGVAEDSEHNDMDHDTTVDTIVYPNSTYRKYGMFGSVMLIGSVILIGIVVRVIQKRHGHVLYHIQDDLEMLPQDFDV